MIAQKVVEANQPQEPACALITLTDSIATTFRTFLCKHIRSNFLRETLTKLKRSKKTSGITTAVFLETWSRRGLVTLQ
jgi:hypothetical protein